MSKIKDLTGMKYGKLTVIKRAEDKNKQPYWLCKCDCGNETIIRGKSLREGHTKSCGCLHKKKNKIIRCNDQKSIIVINNNQLGRLFCFIDTENIEKVKDYYWNVRIDKRHPNCTVYVETHHKRKRIHLHRLIMNCPEGFVIDHIDGNGLNNTKANLRIVTQHQNCLNKAKKFYKGYSFFKRDNYYQVYVAGRIVGRFRTEKEAIEYRKYIDTLIKKGDWDTIENLKCINLSSRGKAHQE